MAKTGLTRIDEVVRRAIIGDGTAFTYLWDSHIDNLRSFLKSCMKGLDEFDIDDICSRSFEKAFRQIGSYDPSISQFSTWLRTIAYRTALDSVDQKNRTKKKYVRLDESLASSAVDFIPDGEDSALDNIINDEDIAETERYINGLPELYKDVARLRLIDDLPYKDIADELKIELNTVRTRIRRAKMLIDKMKREG